MRAPTPTLLCAALALSGCPEETAPPASDAAAATDAATSTVARVRPPPPVPAPPTGDYSAAPDDDAREAARALYANRCATCHGDTGAGDGAAAAALNPRPRSLRDPTWQRSVTDAHLAKVIVRGGAAVGLSAMMAPNPDLETRPKVVGALVEVVRGFAPPP